MCPLCGSRFKTLTGLLNHFRRRHLGELGVEEGRVVCPCCMRVFGSGRSLAAHAGAFATLDECHAILYLAVTRTNTVGDRSLREAAYRVLAR